KGLAGGVVAALAELTVAPDPRADEELGVTARDEQHEVGKIDIAGEPRGERVRFEMVDRDKRLLRRPGDTLGRHRADDQPADKAGPGCGGNPVEVGDGDLRLRQRAAD